MKNHCTLISPDTWDTQTWKNGGGITHELASERDELGIIWRLSIADVSQNGPFSLFPHIERTILLLEGDGFKLVFRDKTQIINLPYKPFYFKGEEPIECTLLSGAVRDFNLMTRREKIKPTFQVLDLAPHFLSQISLSRTHKYICYIAKGSVNVSVNAASYCLEQNHTLILDTESDYLELQNQSSVSVVFLITLNKATLP